MHTWAKTCSRLRPIQHRICSIIFSLPWRCHAIPNRYFKELFMFKISPNTATEINHLHNLASQNALQAIGYANDAGLLLQKVKDQLPHGAFKEWIAENVAVSLRQAQRYMAIAAGKDVPIRGLSCKSDTVSLLPLGLSIEEADSLADGTWVPKWKPQTGSWYTTLTENGAYWVVPDLNKPDRFHVSRLYNDDAEDDDSGLFEGTRWAESADFVEIKLKGLQLVDPGKAIWKTFKRAGLSEPFGAPEGHGKIKVIGKDGQARRVQDAS